MRDQLQKKTQHLRIESFKKFRKTLIAVNWNELREQSIELEKRGVVNN